MNTYRKVFAKFSNSLLTSMRLIEKSVKSFFTLSHSPTDFVMKNSRHPLRKRDIYEAPDRGKITFSPEMTKMMSSPACILMKKRLFSEIEDE